MLSSMFLVWFNVWVVAGIVAGVPECADRVVYRVAGRDIVDLCNNGVSSNFLVTRYQTTYCSNGVTFLFLFSCEYISMLMCQLRFSIYIYIDLNDIFSDNDSIDPDGIFRSDVRLFWLHTFMSEFMRVDLVVILMEGRHVVNAGRWCLCDSSEILRRVDCSVVVTLSITFDE